MKKYMVVEGRMFPDGLYYLNSWVNKAENICFQLMETNDQQLFDEWINNWKDYTDFEVFPID